MTLVYGQRSDGSLSQGHEVPDFRARVVRLRPNKDPVFRDAVGVELTVIMKHPRGYDVDLGLLGYPGDLGFLHPDEVEEVHDSLLSADELLGTIFNGILRTKRRRATLVSVILALPALLTFLLYLHTGTLHVAILVILAACALVPWADVWLVYYRQKQGYYGGNGDEFSEVAEAAIKEQKRR